MLYKNKTYTPFPSSTPAPCAPTRIEAMRDCVANHVVIIWQDHETTGTYTAVMEDHSGGRLNCTSTSVNHCKIPNLPCGTRYNVTVTHDDGICHSTSTQISTDSGTAAGVTYRNYNAVGRILEILSPVLQWKMLTRHQKIVISLAFCTVHLLIRLYFLLFLFKLKSRNLSLSFSTYTNGLNSILWTMMKISNLIWSSWSHVFSPMRPYGCAGECGLQYRRADSRLEHIRPCGELHHPDLQRQ